MKHRAPIVVVPYSTQWAVQFLEERSRLLSALPGHAVLEHIGSTAVPGLHAKPIIDMMLGASSLAEVENLIPVLELLGYEYMPVHEAEIPDRRFLARPRIRPRMFHLHGVTLGSRFWLAHLKFRDRLRQDSALAAAYANLKVQLAQRFGDDRAGYTDAKSSFIERALHGASASEA